MNGVFMKDKLIIFDTTLRDGEQSPGASMTRDEKIRIAKALERLKVDVIEAGFPAASPGDYESVQAVANVIKDSTVCGLARALDKDIDRAGTALKGANRSRIHTFIATSPIHMQMKLQMSPEQVIDHAVKAVKRALQYTDGLMETSRRDAAAMVRTAVSHTANFTRTKFYEENSDLLKGEKFLATLDSKTTIRCASLDGQIFPVGKGPIPPIHWNCRSTRVGVVKSWKELGIDLPESAVSTRASLDGQVPEDMTYSKWLRGRSAEFQDDVLGAARGKLFRANKIELDRFVDRNGRMMTLDQLRKKNSEMFANAGM